MKWAKSVILSIGILSVVACTPIEHNQPSHVYIKRDDSGTADYFLKGLAGLMVKLGRTKPKDVLTKMFSGTASHLEGAALGSMADIKSKMFAILQTYQDVVIFTLGQMKDKISFGKFRGLADAAMRNISGLAKEAKVRIHKDAKQKGLKESEIHLMEVELESFVKLVKDNLNRARSVFEEEFEHGAETEKKKKKKFSFEMPSSQHKV